MHEEHTQSDLYDTLASLGFQYKNLGKEIRLDRCPFCEKDRKTKSDHFSFSYDKLVYNCVKCGEKGNIVTFRRNLGLDPFKSKTFVLPEQEKVKAYAKQPEAYYQAYQKARGISEATLIKYGVGRASRGSLGTCRTYQYLDRDGSVLNVKYVNAKKEMQQEKDSRKTYYGLQFIDESKPELHVVEGEDDCHALVDMGFENVVSIPSGAKFYNEEMGQVNKKFKKIYLFYDNDQAGQEGAFVFAQKAGVWKCHNVLLPFKDVRECLLNGMDIFQIQHCKNAAKQFEYSPDTKTRPALSIVERIDRFEKEAVKNEYGIQTGYKALDDVTGGLRGGDLFSIVANPGCFKTTALMNILKRSCENLHRHEKEGIVLFFSLEMQIEAESERELMMYLNSEKSYELRNLARKKDETWTKFKSDIEGSMYNRLYVSEENDLDLDGIEKVIRRTEEASGEPVVLVGIDYIDFISCKSQSEYDSVRTIMNGIKKYIARKLNIPVIILCQTNRATKDSEEEVGERAAKGGTGVESASDFMIGIWRNEDRVIGRFTKHRRLVYSDRANPYLEFDINKRSFLISGIDVCEKPIKKKDEGAGWRD